MVASGFTAGGSLLVSDHVGVTSTKQPPFWEPGPHRELFQLLGSPLGPHRVPFSILGLRTCEKSVQPLYNIHSLYMAPTLCTDTPLWTSITSYFKEFPRYGQLFKYTLFGSQFLSRVPIGSPFHSKLGPHWIHMQFGRSANPLFIWKKYEAPILISQLDDSVYWCELPLIDISTQLQPRGLQA